MTTKAMAFADTAKYSAWAWSIGPTVATAEGPQGLVGIVQESGGGKWWAEVYQKPSGKVLGTSIPLTRDDGMAWVETFWIGPAYAEARALLGRVSAEVGRLRRFVEARRGVGFADPRYLGGFESVRLKQEHVIRLASRLREMGHSYLADIVARTPWDLGREQALTALLSEHLTAAQLAQITAEFRERSATSGYAEQRKARG